MLFTNFDRLSERLQNSKKPRTYHNWFLINFRKILRMTIPINWPGLMTE